MTPDHPHLSEAAVAAPVAPWFGGKARLAKHIIGRIEAVPHDCYAEPFVGMGGVFLRRRRKPASEIINDASGEITNLFRVLREHPDELLRQCRWLLPSRAEFVRQLGHTPDTLTDIQRAARFVYVQRLSFAGKPATLATPGQIGFSVSRPPNIGQTQLRQLIGAAHARLERVAIECLSWDTFIARYDRERTLFYLDPPYWGHETAYGRGLFAPADFERMADILGALKGRFFLSLNDVPEVRDLFAAFSIETVTTRYSARPDAHNGVSELLISNG